GDRVLVAGTAPIWPDGSCDPDPGAQARRCLEIIVQALREAGGGAGQVVGTRRYLPRRGGAGGGGGAHRALSGCVRPARALGVAGLLDTGWKVEIEAEAVIAGC